MKYYPQKTRDAVAAALNDPSYARTVFRLCALHGQVVGAERFMQRHHEAGFTEHFIRSILHRAKPFDDPRIYVDVDPKDEEVVRARFKVPKPKSKPVVAKKNSLSRAILLANVIEAREQYEKALREAVEHGNDRETFAAIATMFVEDCGG